MKHFSCLYFWKTRLWPHFSVSNQFQLKYKTVFAFQHICPHVFYLNKFYIELGILIDKNISVFFFTVYIFKKIGQICLRFSTNFSQVIPNEIKNAEFLLHNMWNIFTYSSRWQNVRKICERPWTLLHLLFCEQIR